MFSSCQEKTELHRSAETVCEVSGSLPFVMVRTVVMRDGKYYDNIKN
jgi:hypothetical protein